MKKKKKEVILKRIAEKMAVTIVDREVEVCMRFVLMEHLLQSKSIRFRERSSELVILKKNQDEYIFFEIKAAFFSFMFCDSSKLK